MNLREAARGRDCMVRLPGCLNDTETVVLAHVRLSGISGMGIKSPDLLASWCCAHCHSIADRQAKTDLEPDFVRLAFYEGVMRTQAALIREGAIKW